MKKEEVLEILKEFDKSSCSVFTIKQGDFKLHLEKKIGEVSSVQTAPSNFIVEKPVEEESDNFFVEAPLVASFYRAPAPGEDPFIEVGDTVTEGQVLFILEAMKMINEIKSPVSGKVVAILPDDGELVEFGERIVEIEVGYA